MAFLTISASALVTFPLFITILASFFSKLKLSYKVLSFAICLKYETSLALILPSPFTSPNTDKYIVSPFAIKYQPVPTANSLPLSNRLSLIPSPAEPFSYINFRLLFQEIHKHL